MARSKPKLTQEEVLDRRAQAAREYRQRHRESVNEKARLRMQKRRAALLTAPSAVQLEQSVKAAQYRRNYIERGRQTTKFSTPKKNSDGAKVTKKLAPPLSHVPPARPKASAALVTPIPFCPWGRRPATPDPPLVKRKISPFKPAYDPETPTPRSLRDINDSEDEGSDGERFDNLPGPILTPSSLRDIDDSEDEGSSGERFSASPSGWDGDDEDAEDDAATATRPQFGPELGPLLDPTGHPDYRPMAGERTYWKEGPVENGRLNSYPNHAAPERKQLMSVPPCTRCQAAPQEYQCETTSCGGAQCGPCIKTAHDSLPFHQIKWWTGDNFAPYPSVLKALGVQIHLGHGGGDCASQSAQEDYRIITVDGLNEVALFFCGCPGAKVQREQLIDAGFKIWLA
ncbi:hypothetical protein C8F04DRAFT_1248538 [Mycena alexandri]|uniref:CxC2-like cysteine cluster KDZ transposase-associated domain-containing protein n=1 Tax=Mycena alexandri TaxID=1745969 RepID=A0AAD6THF8_9AGAR|nr:hypothetical protein C8F04DRAFT_1248538 [Mycena alexandri]